MEKNDNPFNFLRQSSIRFPLTPFGSEIIRQESSVNESKISLIHIPEIPVFLPTYPTKKQDHEVGQSLGLDPIGGMEQNLYEDQIAIDRMKSLQSPEPEILIQEKAEEPREDTAIPNKVLFMNKKGVKVQMSTESIQNDLERLRVRSKQPIRQVREQQSSVDSRSDTSKNQKNVKRNKNIIRDLCSKCGLYLESNPRAMDVIGKQLGNDGEKRRELKNLIMKLRTIKNFEEFRRFYGAEDEITQLVKALTIKFLDQDAFVYLWNSSIAYKMETINQIGHFRMGLEDLNNLNQYRKVVKRK